MGMTLLPGGNFSEYDLLSTTTLSGASTTISGLPNGYKDLIFFVWGMTNATADGLFRLALNGATGSYYGNAINNTTVTALNGTYITTSTNWVRANSDNALTIRVSQVDNPLTSMRPVTVNGTYYTGTHIGLNISGNFYVVGGGPITSAVFSNSGGEIGRAHV